jgi:DNA-binding MarR family transcriptional regulator
MNILRQKSSERENIGLLAILDVLENREHLTQRELSQATGLNLKKVNYCLHKLLEKGHVKFQRARHSPDKRTYLYILTPSGLKAKSLMTYDFLKFTLGFYNKMEGKLCRCLKDMKDVGIERIILYGVSDVVKILTELAGSEGLKIVGVVDKNYSGLEFNGVTIIAHKHLHDVSWDGVLITSLEGIREAEIQLLQLGVVEGVIWTLS